MINYETCFLVMAVYFLNQVHLLHLSRYQEIFQKGKSSLEVEPLRTTAIENELRSVGRSTHAHKIKETSVSSVPCHVTNQYGIL